MSTDRNENWRGVIARTKQMILIFVMIMLEILSIERLIVVYKVLNKGWSDRTRNKDEHHHISICNHNAVCLCNYERKLHVYSDSWTFDSDGKFAL